MKILSNSDSSEGPQSRYMHLSPEQDRSRRNTLPNESVNIKESAKTIKLPTS